MTKYRVALVTRYYSPKTFGGTENHVEQLAISLLHKGYTVEVLAPSYRNKIIDPLFVKRFSILEKGIFSISYGMYNHLKYSNYDIIHFHDYGTLCKSLASAASCPYVITTHGFSLPTTMTQKLFFSFFFKFVVKPNFDHAKKIITVSEFDKLNIDSVLKNKNTVYIPNGIDLNRFSGIDKADKKKKYGYDNYIVITSIGSFCRRKNQIGLLRAIKNMPETVLQKCKFIIAGHVLDRNYYNSALFFLTQAKISNYVKILPNVSDKMIDEIYAISDIFVLNSNFEGLPLTMLEAWASQTASILTAVGGIPLATRNYCDSILVPKNNPDLLSEKIQLIINDEKLRTKISKNAYERVKKEFSWEAMVERVIFQYNLIVKGNNKK